MDDCCIEGQEAVLEQQRKLGEKHGREIGMPFLDGLAHIMADE